MSEGTLYPALKRLEKKGWIQFYWELSDSGSRRKYYRMTEEGKKELDKKLQDWKKVSELIKANSEGLIWINA